MKASHFHPSYIALLAAAVLMTVTRGAMSQQMDPDMPMPMSMPMSSDKPVSARTAVHRATIARPAAASSRSAPAAPGMPVGHHAPHDMAMSGMRSTPADHPAMDHGGDAAPGEAMAPMDRAAMDHSTMDHSTMDHSTMDHSTMDHATMDHATMDHATMDHATMDHATMDHGGLSMAPSGVRTPIPALTDADRAAALPPPHDHPVHDNSIQHYTLVDRLEAWDAKTGTGLAWGGKAWIGTDLDRLWLRSEGEHIDGHTESADLEVLYGHSVAAWWDIVVGVRHDFRPGDSQDFAAIGVMGVAPYKIDMDATAYIGQSGQTAVRLEAEYETLLTNRLILQPRIEANVFGRDDAPRGIGSGLGTVEAGLRLRYEFTRRFAPYVGVVRERAFGSTADLRRDSGQDITDTRFVAGVRLWF